MVCCWCLYMSVTVMMEAVARVCREEPIWSQLLQCMSGLAALYTCPRAVWKLWAGQEPAAHTRLCISLLLKVFSHLPLHMEIFWSSDRSQNWWIKACAVYFPWHLSILNSWVCVLSFVRAIIGFLKKYMRCFMSNMSVFHPLEISMVVAGLVQYAFAQWPC